MSVNQPTSGAARASIQLDLKALQAAPQVAKAAAQGVSKEIAAAFKASEAAQKVAVAQAQTALAQMRALEKGATATARAEGAVRTAAARAAATQQQQIAIQHTATVKAQLQQQTAAHRAALAQQAAATRAAARTSSGGGFDGLMGAAGAVGLGVGVAQAGRAVFGAAQEAAFAERSAQAFDKLSGSAATANARLRAIQEGANGTLSTFEAMRVGVQASALGLATTTEQFGKLASAARAVTFVSPVISDISSAISEIALASANMSFRRLDQLGLTVNEVKDRMEELRRTNQGLTDNQLFAQATIDVLNTKYAELIKTGDDAASSFERTSAALKDARVEFGQVFIPATVGIMGGMVKELDAISKSLRDVARDAKMAGGALNNAFGGGSNVPGFMTANPVGDWTRRQDIRLNNWLLAQSREAQSRGPNLASVSTAVRQARGIAPAGSFDADQTAAIRDWSSGVQSIERDANSARLDATTQYEQQRSAAIAQYALANVREEEDFQRSRLRAAQNLARSIVKVGVDAAAREAEMVADRDKRIGKIREEANERVAEQEADYAKDRERAARDHRDKLLDAAARLDAVAVFEEQKRFARESKDADEDHRESMTKEKKQLNERIDQENEAHEERLDEARKADARRIEEMRESLEEAQRIEDEDRQIRKDRQAEDFARQLAEMATAHGERLAQIGRQAAEERQAHNEAHLKRLEDLGIYNETWKKMQDALQASSLRSFEEWFKKIEERFKPVESARARQAAGAGPQHAEYARGGMVTRTERALVHRGEYIMTARETAVMQRNGGFPGAGSGGGGGVTFRGDVHVSIAGSTNMDRAEMKAVAYEAFTEALTDLGEGRG